MGNSITLAGQHCTTSESHFLCDSWDCWRNACLCICVSVFKASFLGYGTGLDTFLFVLSLSIIFFLASVTFTSHKRIFLLFASLLGVFSIFFLIHVIRFFAGTGAISFNVLLFNTSTLLGGWNNLEFLLV